MGTFIEEVTDHNLIIVLALCGIAVLTIVYVPSLAKDVLNSVISGMLGMALGGSRTTK